MYKVIGGQKKSLSLQLFVDLLGMVKYYLSSIAKPGGSILNQRILMYEKMTH